MEGQKCFLLCFVILGATFQQLSPVYLKREQRPCSILIFSTPSGSVTKYLVNDSDLICDIVISKLELIIPQGGKRSSETPKVQSFRKIQNPDPPALRNYKLPHNPVVKVAIVAKFQPEHCHPFSSLLPKSSSFYPRED